MGQLSHGGRVRWGGMNKKRGQFSLGGAISCKQLYVNGAGVVERLQADGDIESTEATLKAKYLTISKRADDTGGGASLNNHVWVNTGNLTVNTNVDDSTYYKLAAPRLELTGGLGFTSATDNHSAIQWMSTSANDAAKAAIYAVPYNDGSTVRTHIIAQAGDGNVFFIAGWLSLYTVAYPSDDLLKFNEEALSVGLDAVKLLQPRRYLKVQSLSDEQVPANAWTEFGFVAQEVEQVPGLDVLVRERPDAKDINKTVKAVDYTGIAAVNTQALKELLAKVEALEARVAVLEGGASGSSGGASGSSGGASGSSGGASGSSGGASGSSGGASGSSVATTEVVTN